MAKLERTECTFVVKESDGGIPYVLAEPTTASGQLIGFNLTPGATLDDAHKIAKFMRAHISGVSMSWSMAG
ncbi:MAG: hypothetical protein WA884_04805 [Methyloceanibacter sp.]